MPARGWSGCRGRLLARLHRTPLGAQMKSLVVKRSVVFAGHKTSVSLEDPFWNSLKEIAASGDMSLSDLLTAIDSGRHHGNLSSAIRLFVLKYYREQFLHRLLRSIHSPASLACAVVAATMAVGWLNPLAISYASANCVRSCSIVTPTAASWAWTFLACSSSTRFLMRSLAFRRPALPLFRR